jgi:hypothetical protein
MAKTKKPQHSRHLGRRHRHHQPQVQHPWTDGAIALAGRLDPSWLGHDRVLADEFFHQGFTRRPRLGRPP